MRKIVQYTLTSLDGAVDEPRRYFPAGTPTVAYASAGGTRESVVDGTSGLLVDDQPEFVEALRRILTDDVLRRRLAEGAVAHGGRYTWDQTRAGFAEVVRRVLAGERVSTD